MKIINNQDSLLIEEINNITNKNSNIYLSCNYFTAFAIFELIDVLKDVNQVNILLDLNTDSEEDFKFIQSEAEQPLNLSLDIKYKINQVIRLIENKFQIRKGSLGNQNILIIENNGLSTCFTLTPLNLDSVGLGVLPSETPILINAIEDLLLASLQFSDNR